MTLKNRLRDPSRLRRLRGTGRAPGDHADPSRPLTQTCGSSMSPDKPPVSASNSSATSTTECRPIADRATCARRPRTSTPTSRPHHLKPRRRPRPKPLSRIPLHRPSRDRSEKRRRRSMRGSATRLARRSTRATARVGRSWARTGSPTTRTSPGRSPRLSFGRFMAVSRSAHFGLCATLTDGPFAAAVFLIFSSLLQTFSPMITKQLLAFITNSYTYSKATPEQIQALGLQTPGPIRDGIGLAIGLFVMQEVASLCQNQYMQLGMAVGMLSESTELRTAKLDLTDPRPQCELRSSPTSRASRSVYPGQLASSIRLVTSSPLSQVVRPFFRSLRPHYFDTRLRRRFIHGVERVLDSRTNPPFFSLVAGLMLTLADAVGLGATAPDRDWSHPSAGVPRIQCTCRSSRKPFPSPRSH